jgi:membrane protein implicated in regulation of membrane protease activity
VGGIAFILTGFLYAAVALAGALKNGFGWYMLSWFLTIAGAAFLVGALFLAVWYRKKTEKTNLPDKK